MENLSGLAAARARRRLPAGALDATVLAEPQDAGLLLVEVDAQPGETRECPGWQERPGGVKPRPGDAALVIASDAGDLWCIAWWPNP